MIEAEKKEKAIEVAENLMIQVDDVLHSDFHIREVLDYVQEIVASYPEADLDILEIATWWHDVGRATVDVGHHLKSAEMARVELKKIGISANDIEKICLAIESHSNRGNIEPTTIEGKILKDADKLVFLSVDRWQTQINHQRAYGIETGIRRIGQMDTDILILPESKEIYKRLLRKLVEYLKTEKNPFLAQYKPEIMKRWKVQI